MIFDFHLHGVARKSRQKAFNNLHTALQIQLTRVILTIVTHSHVYSILHAILNAPFLPVALWGAVQAQLL